MITLFWRKKIRNLHFLSKNSTLISRKKMSIFFRWKTREIVVVLDFLAIDNFDFTRKIVKKIWVKNSWKCWIFGQKFDFSNSFRLVSQTCLDTLYYTVPWLSIIFRRETLVSLDLVLKWIHGSLIFLWDYSPNLILCYSCLSWRGATEGTFTPLNILKIY